MGAKVAGLFDRHARMVLGLCRVLLRDADEAEDASQQTFLAAHKALLNGTVPRDDAAWLATIARNECRARIRKRMETPLVLELGEVGEPATPGGDAADVAARHDELRAVRRAIGELPQRQRDALVMRELYGLSYEDVAAALHVSEPAVESLLSRARRRLGERVQTVPGLAQGALVVPASLRDQLARLIPGFEAAEVGAAGASVGVAGVLAKLAALPAAAKIGAATATVAVGIGISTEADRVLPHSSSGEVAAAVTHARVTSPASPTLSTRPEHVAATRSAPSEQGVREDSGPGSSDRSGPSDEGGSSGPGDGSSDPPSSSGGSGSSGSGSSNSGPGSGTERQRSDEDNSGPGPGSDDRPREDNSGPGSGDSDNSGPGSGDESEPPDNSGPGSDQEPDPLDSSGPGSSDEPEPPDNSGPGSSDDAEQSDSSGPGSGDENGDNSGSGSGDEQDGDNSGPG